MCNNMDGPRRHYAQGNKSDRERQILYVITYMQNLKNKTNDITKQKQTHRYTEQTSGYQWGEGRGEGQDKDRGLKVHTTMYKINKLQEYIVQHREYSQYCIITLKGVQSIKNF